MLRITNTCKVIPGHFLPCSLQLFNLNIHYKDQSFKSKRPSKRCAVQAWRRPTWSETSFWVWVTLVHVTTQNEFQSTFHTIFCCDDLFTDMVKRWSTTRSLRMQSKNRSQLFNETVCYFHIAYLPHPTVTTHPGLCVNTDLQSLYRETVWHLSLGEWKHHWTLSIY